MAIDADSTSYLISILRGMYSRNELILSPKFQRRPVWPPKAKSYFIDTLLRGFPVPPLHLRVVRLPGVEESKLEVVDGQQRLRAVFDFLAGEIRLSRTLDGLWAGKKFMQLDEEQRNALLDQELTVFQYKAVSDRDVLQIFERFNANSIQLSAQELRNGRFFGQFKNSSYSLALEYLDFWRSARIFSEQAIARMLEVEFVSELLILQQAGLQDKKNSINDYYGKLDEEWPTREYEETRFRANIDSIIDALGSDLAATSFTKRPLFYTLYGAVDHHQFGVPGFDAPTPRTQFDTDSIERLRDAVDYWTEVLARDDSDVPSSESNASMQVDGDQGESIDDETDKGLTPDEISFREASTSQTDNVIPRRSRLTLFYEKAFGAS